jgi:GST-like protein
MIDVHYWTTPNGHKVTIFLEEAGLPYKIFPVNIGKGEQFQRTFLEVSPNNRIPAIVDHEPAGQNNHFAHYAVDKLPYAIDRYRNEVNRLYGVMDRRLAERPYLAGDYSIADMACYPWVVPHERQGQNIADFPHLKRWLDAIAARPAVVRAYALAAEINPQGGGTRHPVRPDRRVGAGGGAIVPLAALFCSAACGGLAKATNLPAGPSPPPVRSRGARDTRLRWATPVHIPERWPRA